MDFKPSTHPPVGQGLAAPAPEHAVAVLSRLRTRLQHLTVPNLKAILGNLSLPKSGKKADLVGRIVNACCVSSMGLSQDARTVAVLVDQMCPNPAPLAAYFDGDSDGRANSGGHQQPSSSNGLPGSLPGSMHPAGSSGATRIRCPCKSNFEGSQLVTCTRCSMRQHTMCLHVRPSPTPHVCELCRLEEVDPAAVPAGSARPVTMLLRHAPGSPLTTRQVTDTLHLTPEDRALLTRPDHAIRVYVVETSPPSWQHRWPISLSMKVNAVGVDVRLPPPVWDHNTGRYKVRPVDEICALGDSNGIRWLPSNHLSATATVQFNSALIFRLVRVLSAPELRAQTLSASTLELPAARAHALLTLFGPPPSGDDEDDDLVQTSVSMTLRCPLSLTRIATPVRSKECKHVKCFDLDSHLQMQLAARCPRWLCPTCNKPARPGQLVVDSFLKDVLEQTQESQCTEVDLRPDGSFVPATKADEGRAPKRKLKAAADQSPKASAPPPPAVSLVDVDEVEAHGELQRHHASQLAEAGGSGIGELDALGINDIMEGLCAGAADEEGALLSVPTRAGVTHKDMHRVVRDACTLASRSMETGAGPTGASLSFAQIRDLFLTLEENPSHPEAVAFASRMASQLLHSVGAAPPPGEGGASGESAVPRAHDAQALRLQNGLAAAGFGPTATPRPEAPPSNVVRGISGGGGLEDPICLDDSD